MDGLSGIPGGPQARNLISDQIASRAAELGQRQDGQEGEVAEAAAELESLFATLLVKEMRNSLPKGMFGEGPGRDIFEGWFDEHLGRSLSESGALELAGLVKTSFGMPATHSAAQAAETAKADPEVQR